MGALVVFARLGFEGHESDGQAVNYAVSHELVCVSRGLGVGESCCYMDACLGFEYIRDEAYRLVVPVHELQARVGFVARCEGTRRDRLEVPVK